MSSFQEFNETRSPWGRSQEEFCAVGVELKDRESLLYSSGLLPQGSGERVSLKSWKDDI